MSRLDELIQQYCPDGVEYSTVGEKLKVNRGKRLTKSQLSEDGKYTVYHGSKDTPLGYYTSSNVKGHTTIVVNTGGIGGVKYCEDDFWCSDGSFWIGHSDDMNDKFVYYWVSQFEDWFATQKRSGGVPTIDRNTVSNLEIPVPPLPVQEEIVRILDKFTELEQELEQELELRKKQYEYYRDKMLSLSDYDVEVEYKTLGEVVTRKITKGTTPTTIGYSFTSEGVNFIKVETIGVNGEFVSSKMEHISDECNDKMARSQLEEFDIMFSIAGAIGKIIMVTNDVLPANTNQALAIIRLDRTIFNPYYVKYYLETSMAASEYLVMKTGAAQPNVSLESLSNVHIPYVSMDEQNRIVETLDKFSTLTSDISEGLPAEIKMRHQQYEYYRDKLLNFKRLEVA